MGIDFEPLFYIVFFALGFVPVVIVGAIVSVFLPIPLWSIAIAGVVVGLSINMWMRYQ